LVFAAALGFGLIGAEKNVALDAGDAEGVGYLSESFHRKGILHGYNQDMKRTLAGFALGAVLMFGANKAVDEAKGLMKNKKFEEAVAVLEPAAKAAPKDAAVKSAMVEALMGNGDAYMYNEKLPPFKKYPAALKSYRRVLEFDKTNQKAKDNVSMIEGIYKSMGRPVPQ
jgi:tetratricopeptide (TPR) repeat protein